jgi:hypothetical protein
MDDVMIAFTDFVLISYWYYLILKENRIVHIDWDWDWMNQEDFLDLLQNHFGVADSDDHVLLLCHIFVLTRVYIAQWTMVVATLFATIVYTKY